MEHHMDFFVDFDLLSFCFQIIILLRKLHLLRPLHHLHILKLIVSLIYQLKYRSTSIDRQKIARWSSRTRQIEVCDGLLSVLLSFPPLPNIFENSLRITDTKKKVNNILHVSQLSIIV